MGVDGGAAAIDLTAGQRRTILDLLERYLPGTTVWAYGSRVKWTSRPQSDLDLVVFAAQERRGQIDTLREAFEESNLPFRVDLFVWDEVPTSFRRQIKREHVTLVAPDRPLTPEGWRPSTWGDEIALEYGKALKEGDRGTGRFRVFGSNGPIGWTDEALAPGPGVVLGRKGAYRGVEYSSDPFFVIDTAYYVVSKARHDMRWLFFAIKHYKLGEIDDGSPIPSTTRAAVYPRELTVPPPSEQRAIGRILGTLDDRIELNSRMNVTLEAMARALFKSWFVDFDPVRAKMEGRATGFTEDIANLFPDRLVDSEMGEIPEGWRVVPLDAVARFQNGLALQKFRPAPNEERLPAVKIAQLRGGEASSGEWASSSIKPACIIDDGDVLFSWSGSLLVKIWCGGRAALNQHLFKVTSEEYPKWFYLHSLLSHLAEFRRVAQDKATTMGHIRRHHLTEALCAAPPDGVIERLSGTFSSLLERQVANELSSRTHVALRDALLPKLLSGEVHAPDAERALEAAT